MIDPKHIPPLSTVTARIMQFDISDPRADISRMETIIKPDKGICSELLKIANSALYGRSGKIKTAKEAITLLGVKTVKNVVIMLSTMFMINKLKRPIYHKYLQEYPVLSALLAVDLSYVCNLPQIRDEAFTLGLLHKIGMSVFAMDKAASYHMLLEESEKEAKTLRELEKDKYQSDHMEVGSMVFEIWKLPQELRDALSGFDFAPDDIENVSDLTRLTSLSGIIARNLLELPGTGRDEEKRDRILSYYKVDPTKLESLNHSYLDQIREHPFYQIVLQGSR